MSFMKNIVCPISAERVPEHLPRITALFVISLLSIYLITGSLLILLFLIFDFIARGSGYTRFSLLNAGANALSRILDIESELIDKAPKLFAARLGTIMMALALLFQFLGIPNAASVIAIMVGVFATLECVFNFCVGCYVYSLVVFPVFSKRDS
jgi:hypothetical protein